LSGQKGGISKKIFEKIDRQIALKVLPEAAQSIEAGTSRLIRTIPLETVAEDDYEMSESNAELLLEPPSLEMDELVAPSPIRATMPFNARLSPEYPPLAAKRTTMSSSNSPSSIEREILEGTAMIRSRKRRDNSGTPTIEQPDFSSVISRQLEYQEKKDATTHLELIALKEREIEERQKDRETQPEIETAKINRENVATLKRLELEHQARLARLAEQQAHNEDRRIMMQMILLLISRQADNPPQ